MIEPKFTPGPWCVVIDDDGNPLSGRPGVFASDDMDCGIVHWDGFVQTYWRSARGDKEIHANAHLIAAAPELYERHRRNVLMLNNLISELQGRVEADKIQHLVSMRDATLATMKQARGEQ